MKRFVDNPRLVEKMGKNSLKLVKKEFSLKKRNEELKKVFDNATNINKVNKRFLNSKKGNFVIK